MIRKPILTFGLVTLMIAGLLLLVQPPEGAQNTQVKLRETKQQQKALIGGDFTLTSHLGEEVTNESLKGQPRLVFFGFTHCPMICPTGLAAMHQALSDMGEGAPQGVFITVDPARDTVERMQSYLTSFPTILGLTGPKEAVDKAQDVYKVYAQKMPAEDTGDGNYDMNHSAYIYLMDAQGEYLAHFPHDIAPSVLKEGIAKAL